MSTPNYITPAGLKKIQDELHQLLHIDRPQIVKTVSWAAANGDRSENADYIYGKRRMREIDRRIYFLQGRLDNIEVVDPSKLSGKKIQFGATVTIEDENGKRSTYQIIGVDEIDTTNGKISWMSPLAKSLLGKSEGDVVTVIRPAGKIEVEIISVEYQ
jgi:transcription elongation factor GreB